MRVIEHRWLLNNTKNTGQLSTSWANTLIFRPSLITLFKAELAVQMYICQYILNFQIAGGFIIYITKDPTSLRKMRDLSVKNRKNGFLFSIASSRPFTAWSDQPDKGRLVPGLSIPQEARSVNSKREGLAKLAKLSFSSPFLSFQDQCAYLLMDFGWHSYSGIKNVINYLQKIKLRLLF